MEQIFYLTGLSKKERRRASVNNCEIDFSATSFITNPRTMSVRLETRVAIILTRHIQQRRTVFQNVPKNESNMIFFGDFQTLLLLEKCFPNCRTKAENFLLG